MKISIKKLGKNLCIFAFITVFVCCLACRTAQTQINTQTKITVSSTTEPQKIRETRKWIPSSYEGIELGKSSRNDAIKRFGKHFGEEFLAREGTPEYNKKVLKAYGGEQNIIQFVNAGGFKGSLAVFIRRRDKIVQAIELRPEAAFSKKSIIEKYGDNYIEMYSGESVCEALRPNYQSEKSGENAKPRQLVYPEIGMSAALNEQGDVGYMGFSVICGIE